jgi:basic amino acid/polyamine antiporter, APA family
MRAELGLLDCTLLVVGAVIGADVYIVAAMGSSFLGPAQIVAWLAAGILAAVIALAFVQCASAEPDVGGTYAYARKAFGPVAGFVAGWALYLGEWVALPVFPIAFANYLGTFLPGADGLVLRAVSVLFVAGITVVNLAGIRSGARTNDALTIAKLVPLGLLVVAGALFVTTRTDLAGSHFTPFLPRGWDGFGSAVVVIFWAYAGFELAVLPAGEVRTPRRTLPRALVLGMGIASAAYLLVSGAVVVALPSDEVAKSTRPLADTMAALLTGMGWPGAIGPALMSAGAIISIAGVCDVFMLAVARLSFAMARDGFFPQPFARLSRGGTPWVGLVFQGLCAAIGVVLADIRSLIDAAVFFLGICYLATALASLRIIATERTRRLHVPLLRPLLVAACAGSIYLSAQTPPPVIVAGLAVLAAGIVVFALRRNAWRDATRLVQIAERQERELGRLAARRERWLIRSLRRDIGRGAARGPAA